MAENYLYPPAEALFLCRERARILAYCHGRLPAGWTDWAQRHIARCPDCFPLAMRTLQALERFRAHPPVHIESSVIEVEWAPVSPATPSVVTWILVLSFFAVSLGIFIWVWDHYMIR